MVSLNNAICYYASSNPNLTVYSRLGPRFSNVAKRVRALEASFQTKIRLSRKARPLTYFQEQKEQIFANFQVFFESFTFEDTEGFISTEIHLKSFGTFEKQALGHTGPVCNSPLQDRKMRLFPRYKHAQNKHKGFQRGVERQKEAV